MPITYSYDDVTLIPAYSELNSRSLADPSMGKYKMPIIASCMDTLGTKEMMNCCIENKVPFIIHRMFKTPQEQFDCFFKNNKCQFSNHYVYFLQNVWFAVGSLPKHETWIKYLLDKGVRRFCVDMAHGDSKACVDTVIWLKNNLNAYYKSDCLKNNIIQTPHIIAGNVASASGFKRLQKAGANGIRVGVASGQICSTAKQTGMGVPILTNIIQCNKVKKKNVWLIADGGAKQTGDIAKAIYFGADFVMMGKMLASTDLAAGDCYNYNKEKLVVKDKIDCLQDNFSCVYPHQFNEKYLYAKQLDGKNNDEYFQKMCIKNRVYYKEYHGLASRQARKNVLNYASVQGVSGLTQYTTTTMQFFQDTFLRLQASLSYGGAKNWQQFRKKVKACRRSNSGIVDADTHLQVTFDK